MEQILNLTPRDLRPAVVELSDNRLAVLHDYQIDDTFYTGKPSRVKFNLNVADAKDFIALVHEYKEEGTKVFYTNTCISAKIDFPLKDRPEHNDRQISLSMEKTTEYSTFSQFVGKNLPQEEYVIFLKELEPFITNIDAATILETAENLRLATDVGSQIEYDKNSRSYTFEIKGGKKGGKLPDKFTISLPMYLPALEIKTDFEVQCRYTWNEHRGFSVKLLCFGKERIEREATDKIVRDIVGALDVKAYRS